MKPWAIEPKEQKKRGRKPKVENIPYLYEWVLFDNGYKLTLPNGIFSLNKKPHEWQLVAVINKQLYKGVRPSLEEAFKAMDKLINEHCKDFWAKINCKIILNKFEGDLNFYEMGAN